MVGVQNLSGLFDWPLCFNGRYELRNNLKRLFTDLVVTPFNEHSKTPMWQAEVIDFIDEGDKVRKYHREVILDQGRTDFSSTEGKLPPADKVLMYCKYYMLMHFLSSCRLFEENQQFFSNKAASIQRITFIDFGCGPLTSGLSFQIFARRFFPNCKTTYLAIDRASAMLDKARDVNIYAGGYFFPFYKIQDYNQLPARLYNHRYIIDGSLLILNFCYFLAAKTLNLNDLIKMLKEELVKHKDHTIVIIYQNPVRSDFHENWKIFKSNFPEFKSFATSNRLAFEYQTLDAMSHGIEVDCDILCNK
ncbi:MAG: hypothetical protein NT075_25255 [Chloroflexi bacterium]|nr:hypothetical protein [Chloroflexota bacterium]